MSAAPWISDNATALPSVRTRTARTRGAAQVVPRTKLLSRLFYHGAAFLVVCGISYGFFSLMGHSLFSAAQKVRANAEARTETARQDVLEVSRQLSSMVSSDSLDRYARMHGFGRTGTLVASNYVAQTGTKAQ